MEKEVRILNQEQLDAYRKWCGAEFHHKKQNTTNTHKQWLNLYPCPLPPPVKVLTDIQIINMARIKAYDVPDYEVGFEKGYNACLSDLGLK